MANVIPTEMHLGLGPLHPEVAAVMDDSFERLSSDGTVIRSVFASMPNQNSVWVFGVAVTEPHDQGSIDVSPTDGVGVSDGFWKFQGLYGFPY